jgi:hypothetical protein
LAATGDLVHGLTHFDRGVALYNPEQHRPLATRFGADVRVANVSFRSWAQWMRGYPEAALADNERALEDAREIAQAATLMVALFCASLVCTLCGKHAQATALSEELIAVAEQQGALFWKSFGTSIQGWVFGLTAMPLDAIRMLTSGISALQSTGARATVPISLARLATAHAEVAQFENAWCCLGDATTAALTGLHDPVCLINRRERLLAQRKRAPARTQSLFPPGCFRFCVDLPGSP